MLFLQNIIISLIMSGQYIRGDWKQGLTDKLQETWAWVGKYNTSYDQHSIRLYNLFSFKYEYRVLKASVFLKMVVIRRLILGWKIVFQILSLELTNLHNKRFPYDESFENESINTYYNQHTSLLPQLCSIIFYCSLLTSCGFS
jgi:hypothetical protein